MREPQHLLNAESLDDRTHRKCASRLPVVAYGGPMLYYSVMRRRAYSGIGELLR